MGLNPGYLLKYFVLYLLEVEDLGLWQFVLETGLDPEMKAEIAAELGNLVHTYVRPPVSGLLEEVQIRHHQPFLQVSKLLTKYQLYVLIKLEVHLCQGRQ